MLVADDNRTNRKVIAKILERAGHEVHLVDNGERALDALNERAIDVALMDVNMPVMNGIEATKLYRFASLGRKRVPIIALTADASPEMRKRCEDAGMDSCVTKPIEPTRLLGIIDAAVGSSGASNAAAVSETETVKKITSHPKFRPSGPASVDVRALEDLESLGGKKFVAELVSEFNSDAELVLRELTVAVTNKDLQAFRDQIHALAAVPPISARAECTRCAWPGVRSACGSSKPRARITYASSKPSSRACGPNCSSMWWLPARRSPAADGDQLAAATRERFQKASGGDAILSSDGSFSPLP